MQLTMRMHVTDNRLDAVARAVGWVGESWPYNMATMQEGHHRKEAPLGHEFFRDLDGNWHPGWLRDSVDTIELPDGSQLITVWANYGGLVNNGTRYMAANAFWDRATLRTEREGEELAARLWRQGLARAGVTDLR